ncbi:MAG: heparinase II/III family protein, partial [Armatimonadetes bacterium]|nr:heparinase II/III family protein [Armatimonadota bacterium]
DEPRRAVQALLTRPDDPACRERAVAILQAATASLREAPVAEVLARIDENGAANADNLALKNGAYDLALLGRVTGDREATRRAALILYRLSQVLRKWPLISREKERFAQDDQRYLARWDANGLWGGWYYFDIGDVIPALYAYDLLLATNVFGELGPTVRSDIEQHLLRHTVEFNTGISPTYGNLEHGFIIPLAKAGRLLPEPEYVHFAVRRLDQILRAAYYADGMWHEGSVDYHKDISWGLSRSFPALVAGYSDPPGFVSKLDGTRFDNLDLAASHKVIFDRLWEAEDRYTLPPPGKYALCVHDTGYPRQAWWTPEVTQSRPQLNGCAGHAVLGNGEGNQQTQAHLHFSGMHGHEHYDTLQLSVHTLGKEFLSETSYRPIPGDVSTRDWHASVAGHNTVMIDGKEMPHRQSPPRRPKTPDDAEPGIPDGRYRYQGHGDSLTDGRLRFMATRLLPVQVVEAEGERSYPGVAELYRRTVAMLTVAPGQVVLLDIFRVRGGGQHDWMLHGCLQEPYRIQTALALQPREGVEHKMLKDLRSAATAGDWQADFVYEDGKTHRLRMLGQADTTVTVAQGPAMRRKGYTDFLMVRHAAAESCFVVVHEFFAGAPVVKAVRRLPGVAAADVAVEVELADGRTQVLYSAFAEEPAATALGRQDAGAPTARVQARFACLCRDAQGWQSAYLVGGQALSLGGRERTFTPGWTGLVRAVKRRETGADDDVIAMAEKLPAERMAGRVLLVDYADELRQAFPVREAKPAAEGTALAMGHDPGFTVTGDLIKLHYYPLWGIRGACRYTIVNESLLTRDGQGELQPAAL